MQEVLRKGEFLAQFDKLFCTAKLNGANGSFELTVYMYT